MEWKEIQFEKPAGTEASTWDCSSFQSDSSSISWELTSLSETEIILHLNRWAYEIANGMMFLASKNVVHGDLASRNVLISRDKRVKISDFGLSRRIESFKDYVKTQPDYLPWRWLSPESFRRFVFNEKTDVWAYGVTLWEMYSFGK